MGCAHPRSCDAWTTNQWWLADQSRTSPNFVPRTMGCRARAGWYYLPLVALTPSTCTAQNATQAQVTQDKRLITISDVATDIGISADVLVERLRDLGGSVTSPIQVFPLSMLQCVLTPDRIKLVNARRLSRAVHPATALGSDVTPDITTTQVTLDPVPAIGKEASSAGVRPPVSKGLRRARARPRASVTRKAAASANSSERSQVFISYSHKDHKWLERIQVHLRPLERENRIERWDDTRIQPGSQWRIEIKRALERARVAVLLVSADFLASDFIQDDELPPLLTAAQEGGAVVLPIIVSPSLFERSRLAAFQAVNPPSSPLIQMSSAKRERLFAVLATAIDDAFRLRS